MAKFEIGSLVVLKSGSMRMCVEEASEEAIACVWCHEGVIGRDRFHPALLNQWEFREDSGGRDDHGQRRPGTGKPYGGPRDGGGKPHGGRDGGRDGGRGGRDDGDRPRKTGWDGKPREKKYFRKDD